jgi:hypothetical protein
MQGVSFELVVLREGPKQALRPAGGPKTSSPASGSAPKGLSSAREACARRARDHIFRYARDLRSHASLLP